MKIFLLLTAFLLVALSLACGRTVSNNSHVGMDHNAGSANHASADHSAMKSSPGAASAPYDLQFLDTMIVHHQGALNMAEPALMKAHHAELLTLAKNINSSQKQEIEQMREWRDKWFPKAAPAINMELPGMADSMKEMNYKQFDMLFGNDFDLEFIKQMIPHHAGAVQMANEARQRSTREEIKTLSNAIIKAQQAEIDQLKEWQAAWRNQ